MYNGNQWDGAKFGDVEPVQKNFIKSIVKYKVAVIHDNLYAIVFSSQNYENREFAKQAQKICDMLNRYAARLWEKDKMDYKGRRITKDAAINDEGILYVYYDAEQKTPVNEIVKKSEIYYGNENNDDIQSQPYILIRKRMTITEAVELAMSEGLDEEKTKLLASDNDTFEESGEAAREELDDGVTIVYKFWKEKGTVHYAVSGRQVEIVKDADTGLTLYPIAHFNWEEKEGSARGEGEVRALIPNQIEVNRTEMRRVITVKQQAYPMKVADTSKISNKNDLNKVGAVIKTNGQPVEDVRKIFGTITPAQMSPDVKQLQDDLIQVTRELAGAGEIATGQINPENASGRAILAVQQASQSPMTEQKESYKNFIEDVAKIWLEYLIVNSPNGVKLEEEIEDPSTGEKFVQMVQVQQVTLQELKASVRVDVTPKSVYDRFAREQTIENLLTNGYFTPARVNELEIYYKLLDDESVAPKTEIGEAIEYIKDQQKKIAQMQSKAQLMTQRVQQFLMNDADTQAQQVADAAMHNQQGQQEISAEEEVVGI